MPDFGRWTSNGGDPSLNEINRTDRFLDSLAYEQPVYATDPGEAELAHLLVGWRDDVRDAPLTAALTPRDAVLALDNARATRRRSRMTLAVVGSAAAAVLCLGGFASVVAGAGPGDTLYGLRTMLFGEPQTATRDDAVVLAAQTQMAEVQQLIDQGQWEAAQDKLQTLTTTVATVNDVERKQDLVTEWQQLTVKVEAQDPAATIPPDVPPPVFPDVPPVVVLDTPTSTSPSDAMIPPSDMLVPPTNMLTPPSETTPPSTPLPTPSTPLPTPSTPLPTPSTPLPTPSTATPIPTPTTTPIPTPTTTVSISARPLPVPPVPPSEVVQQEETTSVAPPILRSPPPGVVTTTVAVPAQPPSEAAQEDETASEEPPILREAPESVVTTSVEVPDAPE